MNSGSHLLRKQVNNLVEIKNTKIFHSHKRNCFLYDPKGLLGNVYSPMLEEEHSSSLMQNGNNEGGKRMAVEKIVENLSHLCRL